LFCNNKVWKLDQLHGDVCRIFLVLTDFYSRVSDKIVTGEQP